MVWDSVTFLDIVKEQHVIHHHQQIHHVIHHVIHVVKEIMKEHVLHVLIQNIYKMDNVSTLVEEVHLEINN